MKVLFQSPDERGGYCDQPARLSAPPELQTFQSPDERGGYCDDTSSVPALAAAFARFQSPDERGGYCDRRKPLDHVRQRSGMVSIP